MNDGTALGAVELFVAALAALSLVALVARRVGLPYSVALVVCGVAVSAASPVHPGVPPDLVLAVLIPGLVFEAAFQLDVRELRRVLPSTLALAVPGVLVVAGIVALVLHAAAGMSLAGSFVVGAMVSATDPVAVIASMRRLHAPVRLATLVDAESLLNDGTGIVLFTIAVAAADGGGSIGESVVTFVVVVSVSAVLGAAAGFAVSRVVAAVDDHLVELTITLVLAYGTYLVADRLGLSGIIATVVAGIVMGSYGREFGLSQQASEAIDTVWEFIAFLLTALVFLLIGFAMTIGQLADAAAPIAWGVVAILVGRAVVVYLGVGVARNILARVGRGRPLPLGWQHVLFWSGLRGAVAVAMALSLPTDFPDRSLLQGTVYGVVLFTVLVQGTTASWVLRRSGARNQHPDAEAGIA